MAVHTIKMSLKKIKLGNKEVYKKTFIRQNKLFH